MAHFNDIERVVMNVHGMIDEIKKLESMLKGTSRVGEFDAQADAAQAKQGSILADAYMRLSYMEARANAAREAIASLGDVFLGSDYNDLGASTNKSIDKVGCSDPSYKR